MTRSPWVRFPIGYAAIWGAVCVFATGAIVLDGSSAREAALITGEVVGGVALSIAATVALVAAVVSILAWIGGAGERNNA